MKGLLFALLIILPFIFGSYTLAQESNQNPSKLEKATLAGGCFWCLESAMEKLEGVIEAISGYTGGHTENPTYEQVSSGTTGHYEAVEVTFDPKKNNLSGNLGRLLEKYQSDRSLWSIR